MKYIPEKVWGRDKVSKSQWSNLFYPSNKYEMSDLNQVGNKIFESTSETSNLNQIENTRRESSQKQVANRRFESSRCQFCIKSTIDLNQIHNFGSSWTRIGTRRINIIQYFELCQSVMRFIKQPSHKKWEPLFIWEGCTLLMKYFSWHLLFRQSDSLVPSFKSQKSLEAWTGRIWREISTMKKKRLNSVIVFEYIVRNVTANRLLHYSPASHFTSTASAASPR